MKSYNTVLEDFLEFRIQAKRRQVEINFGQSFALSKTDGKIQLNETPRGDATLVPIEEVYIDNQRLLFRTSNQRHQQGYEIGFCEIPFGNSIALFIAQFSRNKLNINPTIESDFHLRFESGNLSLSLGKLNGEKISLFLPQRRATHLYRRRDEMLRPDHCFESSFTLQDNSLIVTGKLEGKPTSTTLFWSLQLQNELQPYLLTMIRTCAELQTDLRAKGGIEGFGTSTSGAEAVIPQNGISQKVHLERLIAKERRIGTYTFDEAKQCFVADSEVGLYITKIGDAKYRFICYFIDGHEVPLNESETKEFAGDEDAAKQQAIDSFNGCSLVGALEAGTFGW